MSYIITAEFQGTKESAAKTGILAIPKIRFLAVNGLNETVILDIAGEFGEEQERTRWFCEQLTNAGIVEFEIRHSF